jgi:hypothetical protein
VKNQVSEMKDKVAQLTQSVEDNEKSLIKYRWNFQTHGGMSSSL